MRILRPVIGAQALLMPTREANGLQGIVTLHALVGIDLRRLFSTTTKISYAGYRFPPEREGCHDGR